jgi:hypothetical protein
MAELVEGEMVRIDSTDGEEIHAAVHSGFLVPGAARQRYEVGWHRSAGWGLCLSRLSGPPVVIVFHLNGLRWLAELSMRAPGDGHWSPSHGLRRIRLTVR